MSNKSILAGLQAACGESVAPPGTDNQDTLSLIPRILKVATRKVYNRSGIRSLNRNGEFWAAAACVCEAWKEIEK